MVGVTEITGAIGGLKAAMDIVKGLNATAGAVAINDAKIALQATILEAQAGLLGAQESQTANLKRIDELEAKIAKLETWEREKERYQLEEFPTGALAYVLKADDQAGQPHHRICARCYEDGHKSILQTTMRHGGGERVECTRCGAKMKLSPFPAIQVDRGPSFY